ncbi:MAG TPA: hypothetical protein VNQ90_19765 [Chthoniobacteraceae bacterium]|nr:hypothetical protein [Chthoniobacteraceae bacterium]
MTTKSRKAQLKTLVSLEEERGKALERVQKLTAEIRSLQDDFHQEAEEAVAAAPVSKAKVAGHQRRGGLRDQVLSALSAAGSKGISVRELATLINTKPANIHSWFSSNLKRVAGLEKVGEARYALSLNGSAPEKAPAKSRAAKTAKAKPAKAAAKAPAAAKPAARSAKPTASAKPAKAPAAPKAKKAAAPKAPKAVKAPKAAKAAAPKAAKGSKPLTGPARRGELKDLVLGHLRQAGKEGVTIKELSDATGAKYKNLYIWFVTTGKRLGGIEKVGPARYRLTEA